MSKESHPDSKGSFPYYTSLFDLCWPLSTYETTKGLSKCNLHIHKMIIVETYCLQMAHVIIANCFLFGEMILKNVFIDSVLPNELYPSDNV